MSKYSEEKAIRTQLDLISKHEKEKTVQDLSLTKEKGLSKTINRKFDKISLKPKDVKENKIENKLINGGFSDKYGTANIVAIATSTGGPGILFRILKKIPVDFPCGIVIVQHIMRGFDKGLAEWLDSECQISIKIGEDSEVIKAGVAYVAPCDFQMRVEENGKINLLKEGPSAQRGGHCPSGDVLLESVALHYKDNALGIVLTGMGSDGAVGLKAIRDLGGKTFVQNEISSVIFGMPKRAIEVGAVEKNNVLPPEKIADEIIDFFKG